MYDVVIIGGGIIGCATAREISKLDLNILLLESRAELSEGASKANSGIIHAGYDCEPGTLKAELNFKGNAMFEKLSEELDIPFKRNGSLVLAFSDKQNIALEHELAKGKKNGVDVQKLNREEIVNMESNINQNVVSALYAPMGGIASPYEATIAFAESAFINGVKFKLDTKVLDIKKSDEAFNVITNNGEFLTKTIVNAAGVHSDEINNFVSEKKYKIVPRKGEYLLFDKSTDGFVRKTIFQLPTELGKGVLITPTTHGNLLIGPSADDVENKNCSNTTAEAIANVMKTALLSVNSIPRSHIITSFAGLRANIQGFSDFVIEEALDGFVNALGINSPGLSAAPAIAVRIADIIAKRLQPNLNKSFIKKREGIKIFRELTVDEQNDLIKSDSRYGKIVCRCETVTEGEIVDSINRPLGAATVDGVKRRTRSGMGRCQGGFCSSRVMEILSRELNISAHEVTKFGGKSNIIFKN